MSDLRYFNYGVGTSEIQGIVDSGPNLKMNSQTMTESMPKYLSLRWFFMGNKNGYNP
jgi:hypothetical protein